MIIPLSKADNPKWRLAAGVAVEAFLLGFRRTGKSVPAGVAEIAITAADETVPAVDAGVPMVYPDVLTRDAAGAGAIWVCASPGSPEDAFEMVRTP